MKIVILLLAVASVANGAWLTPPPHGTASRRRVIHAGAAAAALQLPTALHAAEPEPMKTLTDEEMAARVARKAELLKKQSRKGASDVKILYGADYQSGKRESAKTSSSSGVAGFLLPQDVGGVNLGNPFSGKK